MSARVLVTLQVITQNTTLADGRIEERLAALVRECFDGPADHASISVQAHDPDESAADDTCSHCGCVIADAERHAAWHRSVEPQPAAIEPPELRTFGKEPAHA